MITFPYELIAKTLRTQNNINLRIGKYSNEFALKFTCDSQPPQLSALLILRVPFSLCDFCIQNSGNRFISQPYETLETSPLNAPEHLHNDAISNKFLSVHNKIYAHQCRRCDKDTYLKNQADVIFSSHLEGIQRVYKEFSIEVGR